MSSGRGSSNAQRRSRASVRECTIHCVAATARHSDLVGLKLFTIVSLLESEVSLVMLMQRPFPYHSESSGLSFKKP